MKTGNPGPLFHIETQLVKIDQRLSQLEAVIAGHITKTKAEFLKEEIAKIRELADKSFHRRCPDLKIDNPDDVWKYL